MNGHLRIVRGEPTPEELAAIATVVSAASPAPPAEAETPQRGRWNDPAWTQRRPLPVGPGGWRSALR